MRRMSKHMTAQQQLDVLTQLPVIRIGQPSKLKLHDFAHPNLDACGFLVVGHSLPQELLAAYQFPGGLVNGNFGIYQFSEVEKPAYW